MTFILQGFAGDGGAKKYVRKAQRYRNLNKFQKSEEAYKKALEINPTYFDAQFELGLLYESAFFDKNKAFSAFKKSEELMANDTVYEVYLQLAKSYHYFEQYETAIKYYELFAKGINAEKNSGSMIIGSNTSNREQARFASQYGEHVFDGEIKNLGENVNTPFAEYVPVFIERDSTLLFTRRGTENLGDYYWDNQFYEDMYISRLGNKDFNASESFKKGDASIKSLENTKKHESVVAINAAQDTLIVYRENLLWYSTWSDSKWSEPKKFDKNINIAKYQRHACFSSDGKTMIFSSDHKEGKGGYDLYTSEKLSDGEWSEAKSLSEVINTDKDEDSPFLSNDGKRLYFASKGHEGMGGYDLFYSDKTASGWTKPVNLGTPMNSPADDIYLKIADNGRKMYLSSDRMDGFGNMDIYTFVPFGIPKFERCDTLVNLTYKISIDANESIDQEGPALIYQWELGDGAIKYGKKVVHTYKRPGEYYIKLNAIDSLTGRTVYDEDIIAIESSMPVVLGKNNIHIESFGPDTVVVDSKVIYDASLSQVPGDSITNYFWSIDSQITEDDSLEIKFEDLGEKEILLEVLSRTKDGSENRYCISKNVTVVSEEMMNEILAAQNTDSANVNVGSETNVDIGSNLVDSLIGQLPDGMEFALVNIYFDFDKYNIRKDAKETLDANIKTLENHKNVIIKVVGHTDALGSDAYNIRLSKKRAKAAVSYLKNHGISVDRIKATLYQGEGEPAVPNKNPDGSDNPTNRQKNRRVEFYVVGVLK